MIKSMDGLEKIDLTSRKINPRREEKEKSSRMKYSKKFGIVFVVILLLLVGFGFAVFFPAQKTYSSSQKTYQQAKRTFDAIKKQNIGLASEELIKTKESLIETQNDLHALSYLRFVPLASWYYNDADHLLNAGFHGLDATTVVLDAIKPYADVLGLKGQGSFVMGSAEQRIQTAILTMGKITPRIDDVAKDIVLAKQEVDSVEPSHYPSFLGLGKVNKQLASIKNVTDQGVAFVEQARPLIKVLPSLLGESKEKKYLVIFQNDKELRPTGGFMTAYAIFRIDKGSIHVEKSDDIYNLDNTLQKKVTAPDPILTYLPGVKTFNLRDSNLSPDFIESMKTFNSLYAYTGDKVDVDGIIALDTDVLVSIIKVLNDEVVAGGVTFTTKNDKRCDCPQVIYQLESITDRPQSLDLRVTNLASVQAQRKDILGSLLFAIMQKALKSSPKLYWGPLVQEMITQANQKHVLFYIYNKDAQQGIEALNAAGRIKPFEGDYLHINEANFGGAKANLYVKEAVIQNYEIANDGSITKTITINYKNSFPPSDCNLERGGLCLNGVLRNWFRIYVPKGSTLIKSQGSEVKVTTHEDLGKTVFEGFLTVRPQGSAAFTVSYTLPFKLGSASSLPVLIQKQPGTDKNEYTIKLNGRDVEKFELLTDKETTIKR